MKSLFETEEYFEYIKRNCGVKGYDFDMKDFECHRPDIDVILH